MKTIVIPSAGTGSRLGDFTKNYNKAMCSLGPKPVISYIIEHFAKEDEIIILLGYKGDLLRQVVKACYPGWNIKFVEVDIYEGPRSGLGYSLSRAYDCLQKPFIFWPNDTLLDNNLDDMDYESNWVVAGSHEFDSTNYRHVIGNKNGNAMTTILPKNSIGYKYSYPYTGVCYIKDYKNFWEIYNSNRELFVKDGEVAGLNNLNNVIIYPAENWIDTGNREIFEKAKFDYSRKMEEVVLEKPDEAIWFIDDRVIKFHIDKKFISDRVKRFSTFLSDGQKDAGIKIPRLLYHDDNVYVYKREPGAMASKAIDISMFDRLLDSFFRFDREEVSDEEALRIYTDFYRDKTLSRIRKFCEENGESDADPVIINGLNCEPASDLVNLIDWEYISRNGVFTKNYHGDFHLENILVQGFDFVMLDWRQNFGKSDIGDIYYDLAKMWHSLIVNHTMVKEGRFTVENIGRSKIRIDIDRTFMDTECENRLRDYIDRYFVLEQAELLTCLIFLNIAACHVYPYSRFLFYLGKYLLNSFYYRNMDTGLFKTA